MEREDLPLDLMKEWVDTILAGLDESVEDKVKEKILEKCGEACAHYHGHITEIKTMKERGQSIEEIVERMNQEGKWCGDWMIEGDHFYSICKKCECPLVLSELVRLSPTFCCCSKGFVRFMFEALLDKPVEVELKKAIGRGDNICHFMVSFF